MLDAFEFRIFGWIFWILYYMFVYKIYYGTYYKDRFYKENQRNKAAYFHRISLYVFSILFGIFEYNDLEYTTSKIKNSIGLSTIIHELFTLSYMNKETKIIWIIHSIATFICVALPTFCNGIMITVKTFVVMEFGSEFFVFALNSKYIKENIILNLLCLFVYIITRIYSIINWFIFIYYMDTNYIDFGVLIPWFMSLILNGYFIYKNIMKIQSKIL